jgi:hypothetical protein
VKRGLILEYETEEDTHLIEVDVRNPLVLSTSQRSEELTHSYKLAQNSIISNSGISNESLSWTIRLLEVIIVDFPEEGIGTCLMAPISPLHSPTFFCLYVYVSIVYGPTQVHQDVGDVLIKARSHFDVIVKARWASLFFFLSFFFFFFAYYRIFL